MKKTILVTLVAAMMLFAFVACDSNAGYPVLRDTGIATTTTEYLVGEEINPADFTFVAYNYDGTTREIPIFSIIMAHWC